MSKDHIFKNDMSCWCKPRKFGLFIYHRKTEPLQSKGSDTTIPQVTDHTPEASTNGERSGV